MAAELFPLDWPVDKYFHFMSEFSMSEEFDFTDVFFYHLVGYLSYYIISGCVDIMLLVALLL